MPIAPARADGGPLTQQLIRSASIWVLEKKLLRGRPGRLDASGARRASGRISARRSRTGSTRSRTAWRSPIAAAIAVLDFEAVIDRWRVPGRGRRRASSSAPAARLAALDRQGLSPVSLVQGTVGAGARAIGGACLPLLAKFGRDQEVLLKDNGASPAGQRSGAGRR